VQSVPITAKVVSSNSVHGEVHSIQHYVISLSVTCDRSVVFKALIVMGNMFVNLFVRLASLFYCNRKFSNRS
jgi:sRNA-binding regulator protein Hfq